MTYLSGFGAEVTLGTALWLEGGGISRPSSPSKLVAIRSIARLEDMRSALLRSAARRSRTAIEVAPTMVPAGVVFALVSVPLAFPFFSDPLVKSMSSVVAVLRRALSRLFRESEEKTSEVADDSIRL